jgi:hypothetical protein
MHETHPARISIMLGDMGEINQAALKYLLVHLNTLQSAFEFELLPLDTDEPLARLTSRRNIIDRSYLRSELRGFFSRSRIYLAGLNDVYEVSNAELPDMIILLTMARFNDGYYSVRSGPVNVLALGDWERHMAPPSLLEFFVTLVLRQAIAFSSPLLSGSVHLGTKGCLMVFTASLDDVRLKSLQGFICGSCRKRLSDDGLSNLADELVYVLDTSKWLGKAEDPSSPAGIVAGLGYNLFTTKGVKPSISERIMSALREEGLKELIRLIGGITLAALLLWLGLKK